MGKAFDFQKFAGMLALERWQELVNRGLADDVACIEVKVPTQNRNEADIRVHMGSGSSSVGGYLFFASELANKTVPHYQAEPAKPTGFKKYT